MLRISSKGSLPGTLIPVEPGSGTFAAFYSKTPALSSYSSSLMLLAANLVNTILCIKPEK